MQINKENKRKIIITTIILSIGFFAVFQSGLAQRIPLPPLLIEKIRSFLLNPDNKLKASDYKDGTIILIKPIATGVGEGRYEAGDIVEIRDGEELYNRFGDSDFLGFEERSKLIPLYLPQKLTEEQKQDLLASEYDTNKSPQPPFTKGGNNRSEEKPPLIKGDEGGFNTSSPLQGDLPAGEAGGRGEVSKITKRRQYGVDYTLILSDKDILTIRQEKALNRIPEVKLENIINKNNRISYAQEKNPNFEFPISNKFSNDLISKFNNSKLIQNSKFKISARGGSAFGGKNCEGAVCLPTRLVFIEKTTKQIKHLPDLIIPRAIAQTGPTELVKTVDTGGYADYMSLSAWESATQQDLTSSNYIAIAKCQHKTSTSTVDTSYTIVDGWTTDATRYIKIWTDPNEPYRHNGVWSDDKYNMLVSGVLNTSSIEINENFVRVEGLEFYVVSVDQNGNRGIFVLDIPNSDIRIGNNMIKGNISGSSLYNSGISVVGSTTVVKIYNNIIYGWSLSAGIYGWLYPEMYIYNNTLVNNGVCINNNTGGTGSNMAVVRNNLMQNCPTGLLGGRFANLDYNISQNPIDVVGSHSKLATTTFANYANDDFHLYATEANAIDTGFDITSSSTLNVITDAADIDNQSRGFGSAWDIGADEFSPTQIYRSVGSGNTNPLSITNGTATLTITGSTASFSTEQPQRIGVGDVIIYANNEGMGTAATNSTAFISGRIDSKTYTVKDFEGHIASSTYNSTTKWAIYRATTALANAENGVENTGLPDSLEQFDLGWSVAGGKNLASSSEQWNIACYGDAADGTNFGIYSWTVTANTYLRIYAPKDLNEVGISQRHSGKWDDTKYKLEVTTTGSNLLIDNNVTYMRFDGIQIHHTQNGTANRTILQRAAAPVYISNCIFKADILNSTVTNGIELWSMSGTAYIWNNIFYGYKNSNGSKPIQSSNNAYIYNNTFLNSDYCISRGSGNLVAKNNLFYKCSTSTAGTFAAGTDYNITDAKFNYTVTGGGNTHDKTNQKIVFADESNQDYRLAYSDATAKDFGVDLTADANLPFNYDIQGNARPSGRAWDIGADEATAGAVSGTNPYSRLNENSLIGYWSFDGNATVWSSETAGSIMDLSGNSIYSTLHNMSRSDTPESGIIGQAFKFDGTDDYISFKQNGTFSLSDLPYTISFWEKLEISSAVALRVVSWYDGSKNIQVGYADNNGTKFYIIENSVNDVPKINSPAVPKGWHLITFTSGGSAGEYKAYIDGSSVSGSWTGGNISAYTTESSNFYIGQLGGDIRYIKGMLDELRIYNRELSSNEIADLYRIGSSRMKANSQSQGGNNGLVGYWSFDGKDIDWSLSRAFDLSGKNNYGNFVDLSTTSSPVVGVSGQALEFDGVNGFIKFSPNTVGNLLEGKSGATLSLWANYYSLDTTSISYNIIFAGWINSVNNLAMNLSDVAGYEKKLRCGGRSTSADSFQSVVNTSYNKPNTWYHYVCVLDFANDKIYTAINGQRDSGTNVSFGSNTYTHTSSSNSDGIAAWGTTGRNFHGKIDEVRVYDRVLSSEEIAELYRQSSRRMKMKTN